MKLSAFAVVNANFVSEVIWLYISIKGCISSYTKYQLLFMCFSQGKNNHKS